MSELFGQDIKTIGKHINNALKEEFLNQNSVVAKFATTASDGKTYMIEHYNLDVVLSVGYRVKSKRGIEFRCWANLVLKEYIIKGYILQPHRVNPYLSQLPEKKPYRHRAYQRFRHRNRHPDPSYSEQLCEDPCNGHDQHKPS